MGRLFVKFVPWNVYTINNLINKTIRFSTLHEFNDFNEYIYIAGSEKALDKQIKKALKKELNNSYFLECLLKYSRDMLTGYASVKEFEKIINSGTQEELLETSNEKYIKCLEESLAFSKVGIFCMSDSKVFDNDAASLMFAHYADSGKGLALLYEYTGDKKIFGPHKVEKFEKEEVKELKISFGEVSRINDWCDGNFNDIKDFYHKSESWEYEKEYRIFSKPGTQKADDFGFKLVGILYTPRFCDDNIKILKEISNKFHNNKLSVQMIRISRMSTHFDLSINGSVSDWINGEFDIPQKRNK